MSISSACRYAGVSLQISSAEIHNNDYFAGDGEFMVNTLSPTMDAAGNGAQAQSKPWTEFDFTIISIQIFTYS